MTSAAVANEHLGCIVPVLQPATAATERSRRSAPADAATGFSLSSFTFRRAFFDAVDVNSSFLRRRQ